MTHQRNHAEQLTAVVGAVGHDVKYVFKASISSEQANLVGCLCGGDQGIAGTRQFISKPPKDQRLVILPPNR